MEMIMENEKFEQNRRYRQARKQAREIKGFYIHILIYCVTIPVLIWVNLTFVPHFYWFPFSMFGWGFGLMFHGFQAYGYTPFLGRGWEERKIAEIMEKERQKKQNNQSNQ